MAREKNRKLPKRVGKNQARFGSFEFYVMICAVLIGISFMIPRMLDFVDRAQMTTNESNCRNFYIGIEFVLSLDRYSENDLKKFTEKYSEWTDIEEIAKSELVIEDEIFNRLSKNSMLGNGTREEFADVKAGKGDIKASSDDLKTRIDTFGMSGYIKIEVQKKDVIAVSIANDSTGNLAVTYKP